MMTFKEKSVLKSDYYSALADYGFDHKTAREQTDSIDDIDFTDINGFFVSESEIEGKGFFSYSNYNPECFLCDIFIDSKRTLAGRYINHSKYPNCIFKKNGDKFSAFSIKPIHRNEEITVDYRQSLGLRLQNSRPLTYTNNQIDNSILDIFLNNDHISHMSLRERIISLESKLLEYPQAEIETSHEFIDGLYRRSIKFEKGTIATGKIHPVDHMDVLLSGEMIIATEDGYKHIKGPSSFISRAYNKKAGLALTDVYWSSYHPTQCKTVEEVEKEIFVDDFQEIDVN